MPNMQHTCTTQPGLRDYNHCSNCRLNGICLPLALEFSDIDRLDAIVQRGKPLQKGETLYRAGEAFTAIYAIRSGAVKTWRTSRDGEEQITGFHLAGEVIGLDGPADNRYSNSAQALQTTSVCAIPFSKLESLSRQVPGLQRNLLQLLSREITSEQRQFGLLGHASADTRVAALLLSLSVRHERHKLSPTQFTLPMSRGDMANFLGLTLETISRVFARLQKQNTINAKGKELEILDLNSLRQIAHNPEDAP
ncbi:fumarate/nitrate reduction transcriptional regulator Fnr [Gilvimarinus sp. DA14]|uniref:fumarate/nitrate reduction transcriptional regulator Fnr n=1 Tax=Gilvimarinus sp. DA14 TaxID=2956798 RepID=UPI0020B6AAC4|nr:fumarate/nitrate reduction transcriptional regulator Fnr [Gilvimarinus sp. DA14]UTF61411.1 fumarate/nitrate reduction transcriptional regulator Fnr [Gilvimarinus sp. DA14]